jgi:predicted transcriptional regulator
MTDHSEVPSAALEDVAYLSRSENRVSILGALARGPSTRRELQESTGTSRTTLDRIVNELEERGWAERTAEGDYAATPSGEHLVNQFRPFVESVEAIRRLEETVSWLPTDELTVGLEHFSDAEVVRPERDVSEVMDLFTDLIRNASEFHVLSGLAPPDLLERTLTECVMEGDLRTSAVMTADPLDYIREHSPHRDRWREMLEVGAEVYRYEGSIPCNVWVLDGTVLIKKSGPEPIPESYGVPIVSVNEAVRAWALELIERYRDEATPLNAGHFSTNEGASRPRSAED